MASFPASVSPAGDHHRTRAISITLLILSIIIYLSLLCLLLHLLLLRLLLLLLLLLPPLALPLRQLAIPLLALPEQHRPGHRLKLQIRPGARIVVAAVLAPHKYRRWRSMAFGVVGLRLGTGASINRRTGTLRLWIRLNVHMHRLWRMHGRMVVAHGCSEWWAAAWSSH